jgi:hypothetical protein
MFASNRALKLHKAMNRNASFCGGLTRGLAGHVVTVIPVPGTIAGADPCTTGSGGRYLGVDRRDRLTAVRTPACA